MINGLNYLLEMQRKKNIYYAISVVLLLVLVFVAADYFSIFGTSKTVRLDFVEARFRTVNEDTGELVFNAGVRCFQKRNNNACTLRDSHRAGIVSVNIPFKRITESSLLFDQSVTIEKAADPKIHMMFIHNDFHNTTQTLLLDDVFSSPGREYTVKMPPRHWDYDEAQEQ